MFKNIPAQLANTKKALLGALAYLYEYKMSFFKALIFPFTALMAVSYFMIMGIHVGLVFLFAVLAFFLQAIFAITTHRIILMGPGAVPKWGIYKLTGREVRFVLSWIGLALMMIVFTPLVFIPFLGTIIFLVFVFYFISRFSLVFPAIATDNAITFGESWERTKQHQMFMLAVVIVFPAILTIPEEVMSRFSTMAYVSPVLPVITTVLVIASLSMAYKIICLDDGVVDEVNIADENITNR